MLRSALRFSWAMSLFGARQTGALLSTLGSVRPASRTRESFDAVTRAAEEGLEGSLDDFFRTGWRFQRSAIDAFFGVAEPALDTARSLASNAFVRASLRAGRRSCEILDAALPESPGLLARELANKLAAFEDFCYAHRVLDLEAGTTTELAAAVDRAEELPRGRRLWVMEGLGYATAETAWDGGEPPRELFAGGRLDGVPEAGWLPLHTGLGLSLARRELPRFDSRRRDAEIASAAERFAQLCASNARPGYKKAVYEALGLVLCQLDPAALEAVDRQLLERDRESAALLWHGAGRGLYFTASQIWPGALPQAFARARRDAPHALARRNALAGLAWAVTLVSFRQPEILASLVERHVHGWTADDEAALAHGISSASLFWLDAAAGGDEEERGFRSFREHRPADAELGRRWERLVTAPCEAARERYPAMKSGARLDDVFRDLRPARRAPEEE